ncbi:helix-turn-helix transcriptional regulator [Kitasatospora purpeofusca]|uniref:helix-turn-helix transcriptional regulator n=1 Tax=Kitasatospora purpeofusca TaxID=67352 RepID=UPI0036A80B6F
MGEKRRWREPDCTERQSVCETVAYRCLSIGAEALPNGDAVQDQDWVHLGQCIARDRKRRRWLQADLAEHAGVNKRTIGNYERGAGRAPGSSEIPAGIYAVTEALGWPSGGIERALAGQDPRQVDLSHETPVRPDPVVQAMPTSAVDLYPAVGRFARAAVAAGGDPALRDLLEDVADRLLQSIPQRQPSGSTPQSGYGLAAYRPHAWAEGDAGVPEDDAARIEQALEEHSRGRHQGA